MMEGAVPYFLVKEAERNESTGKATLLPILCGNPIVCPTSCAETNRIKRPIISSLNSTPLASGFMAAVCTKNQFRSRVITLWYQLMSDSKISPDRGSLTCGPLALGIGDAK